MSILLYGTQVLGLGDATGEEQTRKALGEGEGLNQTVGEVVVVEKGQG